MTRSLAALAVIALFVVLLVFACTPNAEASNPDGSGGGQTCSYWRYEDPYGGNPPQTGWWCWSSSNGWVYYGP